MFPEIDACWLWRPLDFLSGATSRLKCGFEWNVSTNETNISVTENIHLHAIASCQACSLIISCCQLGLFQQCIISSLILWLTEATERKGVSLFHTCINCVTSFTFLVLFSFTDFKSSYLFSVLLYKCFNKNITSGFGISRSSVLNDSDWTELSLKNLMGTLIHETRQKPTYHTTTEWWVQNDEMSLNKLICMNMSPVSVEQGK